jgi:hypothetical protein
VLDLSGPYRKTFDDTLQHVTQVADPFHLVKLANSKLDECRRRVQNETLGHRGRKDDALYRARRLLTKAHERLDERGETKLLGLLDAGDPRGQVRIAWHAKEVVRSIYEISDPELAGAFVDQLGVDLQDESCSPEVRSLGRTIVCWRDQIVAWHQALVSNGPTEAVKQLDQAHQAHRVRIPALRPLPDPRAPLRRPPQLGPTGDGHSPLKSDEPRFFGGRLKSVWPRVSQPAGRLPQPGVQSSGLDGGPWRIRLATGPVGRRCGRAAG